MHTFSFNKSVSIVQHLYNNNNNKWKKTKILLWFEYMSVWILSFFPASFSIRIVLFFFVLFHGFTIYLCAASHPRRFILYVNIITYLQKYYVEHTKKNMNIIIQPLEKLTKWKIPFMLCKLCKTLQFFRCHSFNV